jgi:hypothetical protein
MVDNKTNLIYFFIGITFIIFLQVYVNPVGARFPFQDLMVHDLWAVGKLNFFKDYLSYFGSVVNFSEGLGIDVRVNVKDQISFFDPALLFSIFFNSFISIQIKIIIFHSIGFIYFYLLLENYSKRRDLIFSMSLLLISSLQYISESSTLTTSNYLLVLPFVYYFKKFSQYDTKYLFIIISLIFVLVGNADLNLIFILPLIFIWTSEFSIKTLLSKKYLITYFLFIIILAISKYNYYIFNLFEYFPKITTNSLEKVGLSQGVNSLQDIILSIFFPRIPGPITLFIYAPITYILLFKIFDKSIIPLYLIIILSIIFFLLPFLITDLKAYIPSYVRYHFCITSIIIYYFSCKYILTDQLSEKFKYFYYIGAFLVLFYLIYKGEILYYSILSALIFLVLAVTLYSQIAHKKNRAKSYVITLSIFLFCFLGMKGGFNYSISRTIDKNFANLYNHDLINCVSNNVDRSGIIITTYNPLFSNTGRHDLILPIIEQSNEKLGRTFFHWRHSYPEITSKLYASSGAIGSTFNRVNFFPPSIDALKTKGFDNFVNFTKANNIISINHELPKNENFEFIKNCKILNKVIVNKKADNSKQEFFDTFFHDVNIYRVLRKESVKYEYLKNRLKITLNKDVLKGEIIETVPILFWPSLFIDNKNILIKKNKNGFVSLEFLKNFEENFSFNVKSKDLSVFSPVFLYFVFLILIFIFRKISMKKM